MLYTFRSEKTRSVQIPVLCWCSMYRSNGFQSLILLSRRETYFCSGISSAGHAPKTVKLFINQPQALDFDAAEQRKPVQEFVYVTKSVLGPISMCILF